MAAREPVRALVNHHAAVMFAVGTVAVLAAGCGSGGSTGGDPGARQLPQGSSCQTVRQEMDKLLARGVQPRVEAAQAGKKLSPQHQAEVDQFNRLLAQYLGARCHQ